MTFSSLIMVPLFSAWGLSPLGLLIRACCLHPVSSYILSFSTPQILLTFAAISGPIVAKIRKTTTYFIATLTPTPKTYTDTHIIYARIDYLWYMVSQELETLTCSKTDSGLLCSSSQTSQPNFPILSLIFALTYIIIQLRGLSQKKKKKSLHFPISMTFLILFHLSRMNFSSQIYYK